jgi:peptidoglycan/LPS O-acetylase OafA/YrhL
VSGGVPTSRRSHRRPALDGLRAVAVVAVLAYHLQGGSAALLRGGFLGVDLFFVLSGYLITGLLLDEHRRSGRIDLRAFWSRRVRRLFPALVLVLLAVCAWVWWATPVETWAARRADVLWTLFYGANWHFVAAGQDYFAAYTGASPLRHAWSLAVEEQFYLLWPLTLWGLLALGRRWGGRLGGRLSGRRAATAVVVLGIGVSAVAMAVLWSPGDPSRAYYGTDGRVQELFTGALLALALRWLAPRAGPLATVRRRVVLAGPLAVAGVLVLLLVMPDTSAFYYRGGALLFSVLVAVVIADVELRPAAPVARLLSWRPAVALGVISYGVYLWHWPIIVAWPLPKDPAAAAATQAGRVALTIAVAGASYLLVERWVQQGRPRPVAGRPRRVALSAAVAAVVVLLVAARATALPPGVAGQLADRSDSPCPTEQHDPYAYCAKVQGPAGTGTIALVGDSTARAFDPGLRAVAAGRSLTYVQAAWVRCSATGLLVVPLGQQRPNADDRACHDHAREQVRSMLAAHHPQLVLVSDAWAHHQPVLVEGRLLQPGTPEHHEAVRAALDSLVDDVSAAGGRVALVQLPPPGPSVSTVLASGRPAGRDRPIVLGAAYVDDFNAVLDEVVADRPDAAAVVSVTDLVCPAGPEGACPAMVDGQVVRYDGLHLTAEWSRRIGPQLVDRALAAVHGIAGRA